MEKEYAVNEETGKKYELKRDKYKQFPHLQKVKDEILSVTRGSKEYWKLRCEYLEKQLMKLTVFLRETMHVIFT